MIPSSPHPHPLLATLLATLLLGSCAALGPVSEPGPTPPPAPRPAIPPTHTPTPGGFSPSADARSPEQQRLHTAYRDWEGTPYLYGGGDREGVDCSAFTAIVFRDYLQTDLPRTTGEQWTQGRRIARRNLAPGDLVFFKTSRKTWHVGVMLDEKWFLHASTSGGVTVTALDSPYWANVYKGGRRWVTAPVGARRL